MNNGTACAGWGAEPVIENASPGSAPQARNGSSRFGPAWDGTLGFGLLGTESHHVRRPHRSIALGVTRQD